MGILFSFLSLLCAVWNDLVFKTARDRGIHAGRFVAGVGVVWLAVFALAFVLAGRAGQLRGWEFALLSGIASASANLLLIESLARVEVGVGSTIYRLNLIWVILLAVLFLNEQLTPAKVMALLLGATSIALLSASTGSVSMRAFAWSGMRLLLLASVLRALMGIFYKLALSAGMGANELMLVSASCWIALGLAYAMLTGQAKAPMAWNTSVLLSGLLVCGIAFFLSQALSYSQASIALPISQFNFVGTALLGLLLLNETFTVRKGIGLAAACCAVLLLALS